jgi:hypothetical protein
MVANKFPIAAEQDDCVEVEARIPFAEPERGGD